MPKRRKVLIGLGGAVTLAGCSGETETEQNDGETEEGQPEPEENNDEGGQAVFEFTDVSPDGNTFTTDEEITLQLSFAR